MLEAELLKALANLSEDGVGAVGGPGTAAGARIAEMRDFYLFLEGELPLLLEKWRKLRTSHAEAAVTG